MFNILQNILKWHNFLKGSTRSPGVSLTFWWAISLPRNWPLHPLSQHPAWGRSVQLVNGVLTALAVAELEQIIH